MFMSGLQEHISNLGHDWQSKLAIWKFGLDLLQKFEQDRFSIPEAEFNSAYEQMLLLLLTLGLGLKNEISDPKLADHVKASLENLNSKYITLKAPPLEPRTNRLLDRLAA